MLLTILFVVFVLPLLVYATSGAGILFLAGVGMAAERVAKIKPFLLKARRLGRIVFATVFACGTVATVVILVLS